MKNVFKKFLVFINFIILVNCLICSPITAMNNIGDPMLVQALNNSIKQYFPNRSETQEILEADIPYVLILNANGLQITDISGIEQFTYINSTIDLSNNNISDITPLLNWFNNKNDEKLSVNIFLGNNPILLTQNYKQIYTLAQMGDNIHIYDSKKTGTGVTELVGFNNGRPADITKFDNEQVVGKDMENSSDTLTSKNIAEPQANENPLNTGLGVGLIYLASALIIILVGFKFYGNKN